MILLHGTGTHNKGAELMAVAVLQHYRRLPHPPEFAVPPQFGSYRDRAKYGLWTLMQERRWGRAKLVSLLAHPAFRRKYGLVVESDCTAVIDASGFAFGDQHGPRPTQTMAAQCKRWKSQGKKIVLLPQAFGPFSSPEIRQACRQLVEHCDLVFAREETSLGHLMDVVGPRENIRQAPDFTNLVEGRLPDGFEPWEDAALVVPNTRMLDKTDPQTAEKYLPFVASVIVWLRNAGLRPALLLHTPEDEQLVPPLLDLAGNAIPVLRESCPVALKGILGTARIVVSSRFHALVGALSQGVPAVACGWSHKYDELLRQYDCPECLLGVDDGPRLAEKLGPLVDPATHAELVARIRSAATRLRHQVEQMWQAVDAVLGCT